MGGGMAGLDEVWGELTVRLVARDNTFDGIVFGKTGTVVKILGEPGETESELRTRLKQEALKRHPTWIGYNGAMAFFGKQFREGFYDDGYLEQERTYKYDAKKKLDELIPLDSALAGEGLPESALHVFQRTNLLSPFELMRVKDVLNSDLGPSFVRGAATFASGETADGLTQMEKSLTPHDAAKWTVATYLPFLWRPDEHMFLKPEKTKLFADRVGHEFALCYRPELNVDTYQSLLGLANDTREAIDDLQPRDLIDVQSFVWVVGSYPNPKP